MAARQPGPASPRISARRLAARLRPRHGCRLLPGLLTCCRDTGLCRNSPADLSAGGRRMGLLRGGPPCARAMARLGAVRSHYCALLLAAALAVCAFYYLGSGRETFSSATKRLKEARAGAPAAPSPPVLELARGSLAPAPGAKAKSLEGGGAGPVDYHLLMMFTKAEHNAALQAKARVALRSLLRLAKFEAHEVLNLHFVSEEVSREVAKALLRELLPPAAGFKCKVSGAPARGSG